MKTVYTCPMCGSKEVFINDENQILIICGHCGTATVFDPEYTKESALKLYTNRPDIHAESVTKLERVLFRVVAILSTVATVAMAIIAAKCSGVI